MPRVSVITPVHDRPQFLEEAVGSIQKQSFSDWEHIIVDDGSTNALTQEVLKRIEAMPGTRLYRTENKGLGAARNYAIERAQGEYILTLDDDDKWHPDFINRAVEVFKNKSATGVVTAWMHEFGLTERIVKTEGGDVKNFLTGNNSVHGMFRKADWATCGKYDEHMTAYEDWDLWLRITAMGYNVEVIPQPFFFYRIHKHSSLLKQAQEKHMQLFRYMVEKNKKIYQEYVVEAVCQLEDKRIQIARDVESRNWKYRLKRMLGFKVDY
jgi:glycosyltransferase involved in cell wall biosynthesis